MGKKGLAYQNKIQKQYEEVKKSESSNYVKSDTSGFAIGGVDTDTTRVNTKIPELSKPVFKKSVPSGLMQSPPKYTNSIKEFDSIGMQYVKPVGSGHVTYEASALPTSGSVPIGFKVDYKSYNGDLSAYAKAEKCGTQKEFSVGIRKFFHARIEYDNPILNSDILSKCNDVDTSRKLIDLTSDMNKEDADDLLSIIKNAEDSKQEKILELFSQFDQTDIHEILGSDDVQDVIDHMIG